MEAYSQVHQPEQVDELEEGIKGERNSMRRMAAAERAAERKERGGAAPKMPGREGPSAGKSYADYQQVSIAAHDKITKKNKNVVGLVSKEEVEIDEAITSEKGKAKAAAMIAARTTASGRAKSGQGDNVATIKHIGRSEREGLRGTPATRSTSGSNRPKSYSGIGGTGNKAARRAGLTPTREKPNAWKEEFDIFDIVLEFLQAEGYAETLEEAEWMMANVIDEEAIGIITELTGGKGHPGYKAGSKDHGPMQSGHPADTFKRTMKGGTMSQRHGDHLGDLDDKDDDEDDLEAGLKDTARKKRENVRKPLRAKVKAARKVLSKEDYVNEAQAARENPEKYEREQSKKYAPVRGERTPMPPRGDKRREDFEKWYRANVR